jgi:hypothetical protein
MLLLAACGATPGGGTTAQVTVVASQPRYGPQDHVTVTVTNGLASAILAADHQSNCTTVTIERQDGQTWQPQNPCLLRSATRLVTLAPGSATPVDLAPPAGSGASGWAPGTYRLAFTYRLDQSGTDTSITSPPFTIG